MTANKAEPLALPVRFASFVLVGGLCLAVNTLALWLLTSGLGIHYLVSTVIAFASITPLGFLLNKVLTFRTRRELVDRTQGRRYANLVGLKGKPAAVNSSIQA